MIRWSWLVCVLFVFGCSKGGDSSATSTNEPGKLELAPGVDTGPGKEAEKPKKEFATNVFQVPIYPGAKAVPNSDIGAETDLTKSYSQSFTSTDSLDKIEAFLKTEGKKLGKYKRASGIESDPKVTRDGIIDFPDGKVFQFNLTKNDKEKNVLISYAMMETKPKK